IIEEAFFAQEVTRPHHSECRFLALSRDDSELDLTGLDKIDSFRRLSLRKEFRAFLTFQQRLSSDNVSKEAIDSGTGLFGFECSCLPWSFHKGVLQCGTTMMFSA